MNTKYKIKPFIYCGTGLDSASTNMPSTYHEMLEPGSLDIYAIAGLYAALDWIKNIGIEAIIYNKEKYLYRYIVNSLSNLKNIKVFHNSNDTVSLNDSLCKTVELLKEKKCRSKIKSKYKYLFIDEYQNTNIPQFELTQELIDIGVNVFLVGDERQAIYGFRGSDITNSKKMSAYIKGLNNYSISLNENFRSDPALIKVINTIFSTEFLYNNKKIQFDKTPLLIPDESRKSECMPICLSENENIVQIIKNIMKNKTLRGRNISYSDITILCRKNYIVDIIAEQCKQANIPIEVIGGHGFYKAKEIIDIYKFLNYIIYNREEYRKELYFTDAYNSFILYNCGNFDIFLDNLCDIARGASTETILDYIIERTNLKQFYLQNNQYQAISNLLKLRTMAYDNTNSNFMPTLTFFESISQKIINGSEEDEAPVSDENRKKGVVSIYTIHKAKGLSFPIVIVSNMDDSLINPRKFPKAIMKCKNGKTALGFNEKIIENQDIQYKKLIDQYIIDLLEELRILYVACTRAKHMLVFSCNEKIYKNKGRVTWINWIYDSIKPYL